jgi:hypothetical protein
VPEKVLFQKRVTTAGSIRGNAVVIETLTGCPIWDYPLTVFHPFENRLRVSAWHGGSPGALIRLKHVDSVGEGVGKSRRTAPG